MGGRIGADAVTRLTLWAALNYNFSPRMIEETQKKYRSFMDARGLSLADAVLGGRFYDFAIDLDCVPKSSSDSRHYESERDSVEASKLGWNTFEPGTLEFLSLITFQNLDGGNHTAPLSVASPGHKDQRVPIDTMGIAMSEASVHKHGLSKLYPRPMVFVRNFGETEELSVASTKYGIRVTITSLTPDKVDERTRARFEFGTELGFGEAT